MDWIQQIYASLGLQHLGSFLGPWLLMTLYDVQRHEADRSTDISSKWQEELEISKKSIEFETTEVRE